MISGFRPEHFLPKGAQEGDHPVMTLWFQVHRVENLGASRLLYGSLRDFFKEQKVIANLPSTMHIHLQAGAAYEFSVKEMDVKYFDRSTGVRTERKPFWEIR